MVAESLHENRRHFLDNLFAAIADIAGISLLSRRAEVSDPYPCTIFPAGCLPFFSEICLKREASTIPYKKRPFSGNQQREVYQKSGHQKVEVQRQTPTMGERSFLNHF